MSSLLLNKKIDYQAALDLIRTREGFDFAGLAFYEQENQISPIKWHYVSGNLNTRYKLIVLRKGKGPYWTENCYKCYLYNGALLQRES